MYWTLMLLPYDVRWIGMQQVLAADPTITDVLCIHSETTTGVVNDIAAVGQAIQTVRDGGRDIAYTVDAMSSFGAYEVDVAELGIDFIVSSANKNIQGVSITMLLALPLSPSRPAHTQKRQ